ncbi:bile salt-activated lipase-like isoform X2 [Lolium rigidum]|uniref:bile salt-activated lipase-like isoform X2 n=1 Tax=Lolium rigidum TaxID=89674 RepID=UPI001F5D4967|nr:bile salt-activated lipase-like isoform X2 [Lolium rigidum]
MPPYPPAGNTSHQPAPPHHTGGMPPYPMHPFRTHPPMGPFDMVDHRPPGPPPSHPMEHMGAGPYSYGGEQGGPRPYVEQPSQRTWGPEAPPTDAARSMPDMVPAVNFQKGPVASENQVAAPTSTTTEIVVPCKYIGYICGTNGSDLAEIKKMSGAVITVHDAKPGDTNTTVIVCGDGEQTKNAQRLIHAFIFCGLYQT